MRPCIVLIGSVLLCASVASAADQRDTASDVATPPDASVVQSADDDIATRLTKADRSRRSNPAAMREMLARLDLEQALMSPAQREHYDYLRGWERVFAADFERGITILIAVRDSAADPVIKFRAGGTLVNAYNVTRRYREAFEQLNVVLDQLPGITDREARVQVLAVAAQLYALAGQNLLAVEYVDRVLREPGVNWAHCFVNQVKYDSLERSVPGAAPDAAMDLWKL